MMSLFRNWFGIDDDDLESHWVSEFDSNSKSSHESHHESDTDTELDTINPATGLVMMGGMAGLDVCGNAYGFSSNEDHGLNDNDSWNDQDSGNDHGLLGHQDNCIEVSIENDQDSWNSHDSYNWNDENTWDDHDAWNAHNSWDCYNNGSTGGFGSDPWE